jgi:hypothetical protein
MVIKIKCVYNSWSDTEVSHCCQPSATIHTLGSTHAEEDVLKPMALRHPLWIAHTILKTASFKIENIDGVSDCYKRPPASQ